MSALSSSHSQSLQYAQKTPDYLKLHSTAFMSFPFSLLPATETAEQWQSIEKFLVACLRTGDDKSAHMCLEHLIARFGPTNERVMGLRGLYQEATTSNMIGLEKVLSEYDKILQADPVNIAIGKRRVSLLKSLSRVGDAIKALVTIVEMSPTDAEAWAELSDLYLSLGMAPQAIHCLDEVLLITPNAWNVHARLAEILYIQATSDTSQLVNESCNLLLESMARYCRSLELCNGYLRAYCGLKLVTSKLLLSSADGKSGTIRNSAFDIEQVQALNNKATASISDMLKTGAYPLTQPEIIVAKALMDEGLLQNLL